MTVKTVSCRTFLGLIAVVAVTTLSACGSDEPPRSDGTAYYDSKVPAGDCVDQHTCDDQDQGQNQDSDD